MNLVQHLRQLQSWDQEWEEKARLFQSIRQQLEHPTELEERRQTQQRWAEEGKAARASLHDAELELETLQERARQIRADLYSGKIASPRELENLRQDGEHVQASLSRLEDAILELMGAADEAESAAEAANNDLSAFEAVWAQRRQALREQYSTLRTRLQELKPLREQARASLGRADLVLYEDLRAKKNGVALAPMKEGVCQICRVTVPSNKAQVVESGQAAVPCEGCGRILYPAD